MKTPKSITMHKFLLPVFISILSLSAHAQRGSVAPGPVRLMAAPPLSESIAKSLTEVVEPEFRELACGDSVSFVLVAEPESGFVTGTNSFNDIAKGQQLRYEANVEYELIDIGVAFANVDAAALDRSVTVNIFYDLTNIDQPIATSNPVLLSDISLSDTEILYTIFTFPNPVVLDQEAFIVMVDFSDTYTDDPSYMTIFSSVIGCGDGRTAFEIFEGDSGTEFGTIFDNWSELNVELLINATVEVVPPSSDRFLGLDYATVLAPNPVHRSARLEYTATESGVYRTTLIDLHGRALRTEVADLSSAATTTIDWDLSDLPTGVYVYHIEGPEGIQTGKLSKH
jgi:hypothetical protein